MPAVGLGLGHGMPCHLLNSVLFAFSLPGNAEEKKQSLGGFSRASSHGAFQFLFQSQNDSSSVTSATPLLPWHHHCCLLPTGIFGWFSSTRDLCLGHPGMGDS